MCLDGMIGEQPLQRSKSWFRVVPSTPLLSRSKYYANTCCCRYLQVPGLRAKTRMTPGGAGGSSRGAFAPAPRVSNPWAQLAGINNEGQG